ncbi:hypothetical protein HZB58_02040 [Candidatus Gottesmanbacteria bacterium]|nr:hypothetical protein [Candidatus Gottesmanbacteria bacterium]
MKTTQTVALVVMTLALVMWAPQASATSLEDIREERREAREEYKENRKNLFEQFKERMSSKTAEIKNYMSVGITIAGAKVTAKTDTTLTIEKDGKTYTVNFDSKTQLRRRFWGKSTLDEFSVGNIVNVIGRWTDDTHTAINARLVRNISIQKRFGVFFGEVKSILGTGWVMSTKSENRADQTVTVSSETKFENRRGETMTQAEVQVGHKVRVRGLWDRTLNTVTEVTNVKDFSLPQVPEATVTATVTVTPTP